MDILTSSNMKKIKKIVAITGARSDYDLMYPIYEKLNNDDNFEFSIIITGPHLSDNFGNTSQFVEKDKFKIENKIYNLVDSNQKIGRILSIGFQIPLLATSLDRIKPDLVLVAGDREEAISVTMTCAYMDIPVAHFFGGDIAKDGNIDNSVRYASSKFAHLHFVTLHEHKNTLIKLGEEESRIFVIGNPSLDKFLTMPLISKPRVTEKIGMKINTYEKYFVLIQHPIITEVEKQSLHIRITLDSLVEKGIKCFLNYPNSDAGNFEIIKAYNEYESKYPTFFKSFKNLDRIAYYNLLRNATCLLGNSSSGLVEVASIGLPAINIGNRQKGRLHGDNVIFVDNNKDQITNAINRILTDQNFLLKVKLKKNIYGDGDSSSKVIEILKKININYTFTHKNITY